MSMIAGVLGAACTPQVVAQETALPSPANSFDQRSNDLRRVVAANSTKG
jgi:hypothetical protein